MLIIQLPINRFFEDLISSYSQTIFRILKDFYKPNLYKPNLDPKKNLKNIRLYIVVYKIYPKRLLSRHYGANGT